MSVFVLIGTKQELQAKEAIVPGLKYITIFHRCNKAKLNYQFILDESTN